MDRSYSLRPGNPADVRNLAAFAQRVFQQTFGGDPDHKPHDMAMFFANELSAETLALELAQALPDGSATYWLAIAESEVIGYIKLAAGHAPDCVVARRPLEIARLYVSFDWHKRGVAHALMEAAMRAADSMQCDGMWLGVWHRNLRAQRFYAKWGFRQVGEHPFVFGTDHQTDLVFARDLPNEPLCLNSK